MPFQSYMRAYNALLKDADAVFSSQRPIGSDVYIYMHRMSAAKSSLLLMRSILFAAFFFYSLRDLHEEFLLIATERPECAEFETHDIFHDTRGRICA